MTSENHWYLTIKPQNNGLNLGLTEVWRYRDLVFMFVKRDIAAQYKQTILGPVWLVLQPLMTTITYLVVFGNLAQLSTDGQPKILFYMSGVLIWGYFANCLTKTSETFSANANIFGKVYFPRLTVPFSILISNMVTFGIQLGLFVFVYIYLSITIQPIPFNFYATLLIPLLILTMAILGMGLGIIISSLTTKYRDLRFLVTFGVQLLMYATPVVYPLSMVSNNPWGELIIWNPISPILESFRFATLGSGSFSWNMLIYSVVVSLLTLLIGSLIFNRVEKTFMDTV